ncbi:ATP-binding cassette domain-containing protein, partial [Stutzerimonas balearica]
MAPPVLEIHDLHFAWPGQTELLHIPQLSLHQGERVFLEGPSGSGKSTLLGLVGGVHMPDRGHVRLLGRDLASLGAAARDRWRVDHTGFIFQQFNLLPF